MKIELPYNEQSLSCDEILKSVHQGFVTAGSHRVYAIYPQFNRIVCVSSHWSICYIRKISG